MTKTRQWTIFTAVAVIVVLAAGWLLMIKPQRTHAAALKSQATTQQQANQVLLSQIAQLQSEERNLPQQQQALQKFTTQVPDNAAEPTLIRQLSAAANGSGVDLVSMTPGAATLLTATPAATTVPGSTSLTAPAATGQLFELPVVLTVTGTYPNVESFFQSLEKLPRATLVGSWSLGPDTAAASADGTAGTSGTGKAVPPGALSGTLNANVFFAPPATVTAPALGAAPATTATTPATTPSSASTPAPTATSNPAS